MKKATILLSSLFCCLLALQAQVNPPYSEVQGRTVISQFHTLEQPGTPEGIFLNALLWVIENREMPAEGERTQGLEVDFDKHQFAVNLSLSNPKTGSLYRYVLSGKVADNIITLLVSDITFEAETAVIKLVKRLPFEKLQPEKKPKHKEYLDEFAKLCQAQGKELLAAITGSTPPTVSHWTEIKEGTVTKGMTEAECLLSMGRPASKQKQGAKTEWMYDSYTYLFFENGVLSSFIK